MRTLNCKRTAQIISLYVAGDLVGPPEREVAAHLAACEKCCRLAEEFSESSSLLTQAFTPPEFGAEFYSGIRRTVLGEITLNRMVSKPSLFRPRWLYATAFAAVVIVSGLMLQHFGRPTREAPRGLVLAPPVAGQPNSGQLSSTRAPSPRVLPLASRHRGSGQLATMRKPDASAQALRDDRAQLEQSVQLSASVGPVALESATLYGGSSSSPSERASGAQVSRIEIQTADPNIRIIWLSSRESREPDGTNHDQDHPETSNRK